jgi:hypothetical protein
MRIGINMTLTTTRIVLMLGIVSETRLLLLGMILTTPTTSAYDITSSQLSTSL